MSDKALVGTYKSENLCVDEQSGLANDRTPPRRIIVWSGLVYTAVWPDADYKEYPRTHRTTCAVCSPLQRTRIFTHWGATSCPASQTTKLYSGFMVGPSSGNTGGGANFLCMHPLPQFKKRIVDLNRKSKLYGAEYALNDEDVACSVCEYNTDTTAVYVQWGRVRCSSGHTTAYTGLTMASSMAVKSNADSVCVNSTRATSVASSKNHAAIASMLYPTQMFQGAADEGAYRPFREVACAVCSASSKAPGGRVGKWVGGWLRVMGERVSEWLCDGLTKCVSQWVSQ